VYPDSGINPASPLPRSKPQIDNTTTLVYPQVPPTSDETSAMDHLLDLEWTVVDEVDAALASAGSPVPSPPARQPAPQPATVTRPAQEPTRPRGPSEENRGTPTAPARAPAPDRTNTEVEDHCEDHWTENNPYGRGLQAPRLPRLESLCWRCGVPGHSRGDCRAPSVLFCSRCGTMGLMSRERNRF
jgi:hypothetical protein